MNEEEIRFVRDQSQPSFYKEVQDKVDLYFKQNAISSHANGEMIIKSLILMTVFILLYANLLWGVGFLVTYALLGLMQGLIGFNITHDALHGAYSVSPKINRILGYIFDMNGESSYVWKKSHNGLHHTYTNIAGHDEDIDKQWLLRFSPHDRWYPFHRWQHIYTPLLYSFVTLSWVLWGDYGWMRRLQLKKEVPLDEQIYFYAFKAINLALMFFIPLIMTENPWWVVVIGFVLMHMTAGITISVVFQLAHLVEGVDFPIPEDGIIHDEWAIHEMKTTANFAPENRLLSWFLGGLNFQVEHHLFPRVCHVHYPEVRKIVKEIAEKRGVPHHEKASFYEALSSHITLLKRLGNQRVAK